MVIFMENRICEAQCGIVISKRTVKQHGFIRTLNSFDNCSTEKTSVSLSMLSDGIAAYQNEPSVLGKSQHLIVENLRHGAFR